MAAIYNDTVITFKGKQYTIKPDFEIINRIEMSRASGGLGISLAGLAARAAMGDVPVSEVARILGFMLRSQGASASDEDIYVTIMTEADARPYIDAVTSGFFPVIQESKSESGGKKK